MKSIKLAAIALVALLTACNGRSSETGVENVVVDTIAEEVAAAADSVADKAVTEMKSDAVVVFDNDSKAEAKDGKPLVIDFSATWCGPCQQFKPIFHKVAEKYAGKATFATADVDICSKLAQKYKIESIPYLLIINPDGTTADFVGKMSESEFEKFLTDNMK